MNKGVIVTMVVMAAAWGGAACEPAAEAQAPTVQKQQTLQNTQKTEVAVTKSVAKELASRGVRCNAIAPGFIRTDMTGELSESQVEALKGLIPLGALGEAQDIAGVARFLAGPAARYITGQVLAVDGGMVM